MNESLPEDLDKLKRRNNQGNDGDFAGIRGLTTSKSTPLKTQTLNYEEDITFGGKLSEIFKDARLPAFSDEENIDFLST